MSNLDLYDVFISYRRKDGAVFAEGIANELKKQGFSVFFDKKVFEIGDEFPSEIERIISNAKEFILVVTEEYFGSNGKNVVMENDWVRTELKLALGNSNLNIYPILVGTNPPLPEMLPKDIRRIADMNFYIFNSQYDTISKVIDGIKGKFDVSTLEYAATGKILKEINAVDVNDNTKFNILCKRIINSIASDVEVNALIHILEFKDSDNNYYRDDYRFVAFYTLFSYYRRMHYTDKLISFVEKYVDSFGKYDFFYYSLTEYFLLKFRLARTSEEEKLYLSEMKKNAKLAKEKIPSNNGIIHSFCVAVSLAALNGVEAEEGELKEADVLIDSIIDKDKTYAKYYATKADILCCMAQFDEALKNIRYAQTLERPGYDDWILRISEYNKKECIIRIKQANYRPMNEE